MDETHNPKSARNATEFMSALTKLRSTDEFFSFLGDFSKIRRTELNEEEAKALLPVFALVRDKFIYSLLSRYEFNFDMFKAVSLWINFQPDIPPLEPLSDLSDRFRKKLETETDPVGRFIFSNMVLVAALLNRDEARAQAEYARNLSRLRPEAVLATEENFNIFAQALRQAFPDVAEFMKLFVREAFVPEYWERDIIQRKAVLLWIVAVFRNVYGLQEGLQDVYPELLKIFQAALQKNDAEIAFHLHYVCQSIFLNLAKTQGEFSRFNADVEQPLSRFLAAWAAQNGIVPVDRDLPPDRLPLRIGFIYDRLVANSPFRVLYSLLRSMSVLNDKRFKIYLYDYDYVDKSSSYPEYMKAITELGVVCHNAHRSLPDVDKGLYYDRLGKALALRKKIIDDRIDMLVMGDSREPFNFLFTTRTAPRQVFWNQGNNVYDVSGIDARITHGGGAKTQTLDGYTYMVFQQALDPVFYTPHIPQDELKRLRARFPADAVLLGTISRQAKVESRPYLEAVRAILHENSGTVFIILGIESPESLEKQFLKWGLRDRVYFEGVVNPHPYGYIFDVFLDTFPHTNGESLAEYIAKGGLFVRVHPHAIEAVEKGEESFSDDVDPGNLNRQFAYSRTDYVAVASHLIRNVVKDPIFKARIIEAAGQLTYMRKGFAERHLPAQSFFGIMESLRS